MVSVPVWSLFEELRDSEHMRTDHPSFHSPREEGISGVSLLVECLCSMLGLVPMPSCVVAHTYNQSTPEVEAKGSEVPGHPGLYEAVSKNRAGGGGREKIRKENMAFLSHMTGEW